jgi:transketolase
MRSTFIQTLRELADRDPRILLLTADLGYTVLESFVERHPDRFFNVGVAEQNMVGLATGLADAGFVPFLYSIATFASLRPYEFIRNGPVFHRLPVRIIGVGGGFEYGPAGRTHHALEDVGVMRIQPGLRVIAPADFQQARTALLATWDAEGPTYYRLGKDERAAVPGLAGRFEPGRAQRVRDGRDLLLIAMGSVAVEAAAAADTLAARGVEAGIVVVASINPAPVEDLADVLGRVPLALVVEAHYAAGGVGSLVSEVVAERGIPCRVVRCGVRSSPGGATGSQAYLNAVNGISSERLVERALESLRTLQ